MCRSDFAQEIRFEFSTQIPESKSSPRAGIGAIYSITIAFHSICACVHFIELLCANSLRLCLGSCCILRVHLFHGFLKLCIGSHQIFNSLCVLLFHHIHLLILSALHGFELLTGLD